METQRGPAGKTEHMALLFLADEQEDMIDRYLDRGTMFVLDDGGIQAECVVTDEGNGVLEIKNIAVSPQSQRRGYGRLLIRFLEERYRGRFQTLQAGTGDSPLTLPFYRSCGFAESHRILHFLPTTTTISHHRRRKAAGGHGLPAGRSWTDPGRSRPSLFESAVGTCPNRASML